MDSNQNVIKDLDGESFKWWPWYEKYGKKWYWVGPEFGVKFKSNNTFAAGDYFIKVSNTNNKGNYVLATGDIEKFGPFVIGRTSIPETGIYSVCCAVQNLWLAARTEGLGLGWVSILSNDILKEQLRLPEHVVPVAYLCLGHVNKFETKPDLERSGWLPRLDLKDVVYYEKWEQKQSPSWNKIEQLIKTNLDTLK